MMNNAPLDANTLIAALDASHADHRRAHRFVSGLGEFHTSPQAQGAFLRLFTRPWTDTAGERRPPRMSTGEALSHLKAILALAGEHGLSLATPERKLGNMDDPKSPVVHAVA
jgi:hypothetical protein